MNINVLRSILNVSFFLVFLSLFAGCYSPGDDSIQKKIGGASLFQELMMGEKAQAITKLAGGASGSGIFKVKSDKQNYILRIMDKSRHSSSINAEIEVSKVLGDMGVAPKVHASSNEHAAIIMDVVDGETLMTTKLNQGQIKDLATKLRLAHQAKTESFSYKYTTKEFVEKLVKEDLGFPIPEIYKKAISKLSPQFKILDQSPEYVLAHTDLNPGNFIESSSGIKIIDWEDARITHPFFDIAAIFTFYDLSQDDKELFLDTYSKGRSPVDIIHLEAGQKISKLVQSLRLLGVAYRNKNKDKTLQISTKEKIKKLMEVRNWEKIISMLSNPDKAYTVSVLFLEGALR